MIQLRLLLLGLTVIGSIGYAVYSHYKHQERQQQHSYGRRRRRSSDDDIGPPSAPSSVPRISEPSSTRNRSLKTKPTCCSICLTNVVTDIRYLNCGHGFHQYCIQVWLDSEKTTCPNCRAEVL